MSYDLMAFEVTSAPNDPQSFMVWFQEQTEWKEDHAYDDPLQTSENLRTFYYEIIKIFPNMNDNSTLNMDVLAKDERSEDYFSDYSIGHNIIYVAFAWSQCELAYETMKNLCKTCGVGFFDVSGDGAIILPNA